MSFVSTCVAPRVDGIVTGQKANLLVAYSQGISG
jgi:hypothetical protein